MGKGQTVRANLQLDSNVKDILELFKQLSAQLAQRIQMGTLDDTSAQDMIKAFDTLIQRSEKLKTVEAERIKSNIEGQKRLAAELKASQTQVEQAITSHQRAIKTALQKGLKDTGDNGFGKEWLALLRKQGIDQTKAEELLFKELKDIAKQSSLASENARRAVIAKFLEQGTKDKNTGQMHYKFTFGADVSQAMAGVAEWRSNLHEMDRETKAVQRGVVQLADVTKDSFNQITRVSTEVLQVFGAIEGKSTKAATATAKAMRTALDSMKTSVEAIRGEINRGDFAGLQKLQTMLKAAKEAASEMQRMRATGRDLRGAPVDPKTGKVIITPETLAASPVLTSKQASYWDRVISDTTKYAQNLESKVIPAEERIIKLQKQQIEASLARQTAWDAVQRLDQKTTMLEHARKTGNYAGVDKKFIDDLAKDRAAAETLVREMQAEHHRLLAIGTPDSIAQANRLQISTAPLIDRVKAYYKASDAMTIADQRSMSHGAGLGGYIGSQSQVLYAALRGVSTSRMQIASSQLGTGLAGADLIAQFEGQEIAVRTAMAAARKRLGRATTSQPEKEELQKLIAQGTKELDSYSLEVARIKQREADNVEKANRRIVASERQLAAERKTATKRMSLKEAAMMVEAIRDDPTSIVSMSRNQALAYKKAVEQVMHAGRGGDHEMLALLNLQKGTDLQEALRVRSQAAKNLSPTFFGQIGQRLSGVFGADNPYGNERQNLFHFLNKRTTNVAQMLGTSLYGMGIFGAMTALTGGTIGLSTEKQSAINTIAGLLNSHAVFQGADGKGLPGPMNFLASLNYSQRLYPRIRTAAAQYGVLTAEDLTQMYMSGAPQLFSRGVTPNSALRMVNIVGSLGRVMGLPSTDVQSDIRDLATGQVTTRSHVLRALGFEADKLRQAQSGGAASLEAYFNKTTKGYEPALARLDELNQPKIARLVNQLQQAGQDIGDVLAGKLLPYFDQFRAKLQEWTKDGTIDRFAKGFANVVSGLTEFGLKVIGWAGPFFSNLNNVVLAGGLAVAGKILIGAFMDWARDIKLAAIIFQAANTPISFNLKGIGVMLQGLAVNTQLLGAAFKQFGVMGGLKITLQAAGPALAGFGAQIKNLLLGPSGLLAIAAIAVTGMMIWIDRLNQKTNKVLDDYDKFKKTGGTTEEEDIAAEKRTATYLKKGDLRRLRLGFAARSMPSSDLAKMQIENLDQQYAGLNWIEKPLAAWGISDWKSEYADELKNSLNKDRGLSYDKLAQSAFPSVMGVLTAKGIRLNALPGEEHQPELTALRQFLSSPKITDKERQQLLPSILDAFNDEPRLKMLALANEAGVHAFNMGARQQPIDALEAMSKRYGHQFTVLPDTSPVRAIVLGKQATVDVAKEQANFRMQEAASLYKITKEGATTEEKIGAMFELQQLEEKHRDSMQELQLAYEDQLRTLRESIITAKEELEVRRENIRLLGQQNAVEQARRALQHVNLAQSGNFAGFQAESVKLFGKEFSVLGMQDAAMAFDAHRQMGAAMRTGDSASQVASFFGGKAGRPGFNTLTLSQESIDKIGTVMGEAAGVIKQAIETETQTYGHVTETTQFVQQALDASERVAQMNKDTVATAQAVTQQLAAVADKVAPGGGVFGGAVAGGTAGSGDSKDEYYAAAGRAMLKQREASFGNSVRAYAKKHGIPEAALGSWINSGDHLAPNVRNAEKMIHSLFGINNIGGWRESAVDMQGHPLGLALDVMVGKGNAKGDQVAAWAMENAQQLGLRYVIWKQRINRLNGKGWEGMKDRGSDTDNHLDHVHLSFNPQFGGWEPSRVADVNKIKNAILSQHERYQKTYGAFDTYMDSLYQNQTEASNAKAAKDQADRDARMAYVSAVLGSEPEARAAAMYGGQRAFIGTQFMQGIGVHAGGGLPDLLDRASKARIELGQLGVIMAQSNPAQRTALLQSMKLHSLDAKLTQDVKEKAQAAIMDAANGKKLTPLQQHWLDSLLGTPKQLEAAAHKRMDDLAQTFDRIMSSATRTETALALRTGMYDAMGGRFDKEYQKQSTIAGLLMTQGVGQMGLSGFALMNQQERDDAEAKLTEMKQRQADELVTARGLAMSNYDKGLGKDTADMAGNMQVLMQALNNEPDPAKRKKLMEQNRPMLEQYLGKLYDPSKVKTTLASWDSGMSVDDIKTLTGTMITDSMDIGLKQGGIPELIAKQNDEQLPVLRRIRNLALQQEFHQQLETSKQSAYDIKASNTAYDFSRRIAALSDPGVRAQLIGLDPYGAALEKYNRGKEMLPKEVQAQIAQEKVANQLLNARFGYTLQPEEYWAERQRQLEKEGTDKLDKELLAAQRLRGQGMMRGTLSNAADAFLANPYGIITGKQDFGSMLGNIFQPYTQGFTNMMSQSTQGVLSLMFGGSGWQKNPLFKNPDGSIMSRSQAWKTAGANILGGIFGDIGGNMLGNALFPHKSQQSIAMGASLGTALGGMLGAAGTGVFGAAGLFGLGPLAGPVGMIAGGLLGGLLGGLFGGHRPDPEAERQKQMQTDAWKHLADVINKLDKTLRPIPDYMRTINGELLYGTSSSRWYSGRAYGQLGLQSSTGGR